MGKKKGFYILVAFICILNFTSVSSFSSETDGTEKLFGFIKNIYKKYDNFYIGIDCAEWLTGIDAIGAAIKDDQNIDEIEKMRLLEQLQVNDTYDWKSIVGEFRNYISPNDYYISNKSDEVKTFEVSSDVKVFLHTFSHRPDGNYNWNEEIDLPKFKRIIDGTIGPGYYQEIPFWIIFKNGTVAEIKQQYIP